MVDFALQRKNMVESQVRPSDVTDRRIMHAMQEVPRELFCPPAQVATAYRDGALALGEAGAAAARYALAPRTLARLIQALELGDRDSVLEIGAGTGYQTAILASLARKVFAIERLPNLAAEAEQRLRTLGFRNVTLKAGDGTVGWDVYHPFDAMLVAAGGPSMPEPLVRQLKVGGRLVIPIGEGQRSQNLIRVTRTAAGYTQENFGPCAFVPLIGKHGWAAE